MTTKRLLLIDGNNLFHRAYHAMPTLTTSDGTVVNAVYGFSNMLLKAIEQLKPEYIACAFDTAAATFRHVAFEKYKAQRPPPPPDLYPQLPIVKNVLRAFDVKYFEKEGYEADDLLASIACQAVDSGQLTVDSKEKKTVNRKLSTVYNVVILSGDRDVLQLVDGNIKVQMPGWNMKDVTLFGSEEVKIKYGITPAQMVDYKSLTGDPSDNVPGVAGIGPKTAAQLLQKYETVEGIYEHLDEIGGTIRNKLEVGKEIALEAKGLVELDKTVDLGFKIDDLRFAPDWEKATEEMEKLGFRSIAAKLPRGVDGRQLTVDSKKTVNRLPSTVNKSDQLELI
jgi:DNA polymerase-1